MSRLCVWQDACLISKWNYEKSNGRDTREEGRVEGLALHTIETYYQLQKLGQWGTDTGIGKPSMRKEESTQKQAHLYRERIYDTGGRGDMLVCNKWYMDDWGSRWKM